MSEWDIINAANYPSACSPKRKKKEEKKEEGKRRKKRFLKEVTRRREKSLSADTRLFIINLNTQDSTQTER